MCKPDKASGQPVRRGQAAYLGEDALLVQQRQDSNILGRPRLNEVNTLLVVLKLNGGPVNALCLIGCLFQLK